MSVERRPLTRDSSIVLVSPAPSPDGRLDTPMGTGVLEASKMPTWGTPPIHAVLEEAGFTKIKQIDLQYNPQGLLTKEDSKTIGEADVLMLTSITRTFPQALELVRRYKQLNPRGTIFMGGFHVSADSNGAFEDEKAVRAGVDVAVRGEGYKTVVEAAESIINNGNVNGVKGVTHRIGDEIVREERRPLLTVAELAQLPVPIYDPRVLKKRMVDTQATSLGCPYSCTFCSVTEVYGGTYRRFPNEYTIKALEKIRERKPTRPLFIIDDNFFVNAEATNSLLTDLINAGLTLPEESRIQIREGAASNEKFLQLLPKVGITTVYVGIESINDENLKAMGKKTTRANIEKHIGVLREAGLWVDGMFITGLDGDTKEGLRELLEWAINNVHSAQFAAATPLPGTYDTRIKESEGRILSKRYHLYDGTHVLIQPKNFTPWELQQEIINMYKEFYKKSGWGRLIKKDFSLKRDSRNRLVDAWNKPNGLRKGLPKDATYRIFADLVIKSKLREHETAEYFKALQNWKPGQKI